ncbi:DUF2496 domain-containing protein [Catenovulum sp. SX2]|uniref:DUF2496 domain-containing protein n=1 Tax=Catenovulum sp. SX2 TaxID=3398614 RepID=UPI003F868255
MSLETAPKHIKLAVDLIYLLETNEVEPEDVLAALKLVEDDFKHKVVQRNKQQ